MGFTCPTDAKNGAHNVGVPRAVASGRADLVTGARATRVVTGPGGRVTGVELVDAVSGGRREVGAGHVVLAGGGIETPRLLLASAGAVHPAGLGNGTDQVGRHLQGHLYVGAYGLFDDEIVDGRGPGVTIATCDQIHHLGVPAGGGVLANEVVKLPILYWYWALPPGERRWGPEGKEAMRRYRRTGHVQGPIQEIPNPAARVSLAAGVVDRDGVPAPRLEGALHPENRFQAAALQERALAWMEASGAGRVWPSRWGLGLTGGQHVAGTCRMGDDPAAAVTDAWGRVHGHDNLWVMDASLHVSNGGFNPVLTIYALALRSAAHLAATAR